MSVFVDTDPAMGIPFRDVDDALAIWLLHRAHARGEGPAITGLSSVFGNSSLDRTHAVAEDLGRRWEIPVYRGAGRPGDTETAAVDALVAHRGMVLAIGPQTNIAAALARGARWERLVVLGGTDRALPNLRPLYTTELNFALDEAAAAAVLPVATHLVPMEPCRTVLFRSAEFAILPEWMRAACRSWRALGPAMTGTAGIHPWDVLAAMWLVRPGLFRSERRSVRLDASRGRRGYVAYSPGGASEVLVGVDGPAFLAAWAEIAAESTRG